MHDCRDQEPTRCFIWYGKDLVQRHSFWNLVLLCITTHLTCHERPSRCPANTLMMTTWALHDMWYQEMPQRLSWRSQARRRIRTLALCSPEEFLLIAKALIEICCISKKLIREKVACEHMTGTRSSIDQFSVTEKTRFEAELEFVQGLASPQYLNCES